MSKPYFKLSNYYLYILTSVLLSFFSSIHVNAQGLLDRQITVNFDHTRLADALKEIGTQGGFYFSYSGKLLAKDSLVTLTARQQPVYSVLEQLFHGKYEFEEQKNYVIISAALPHLSLINTDITNENRTYSISGIVIDEKSSERLMNVSIYEKEYLAATLTDEHGYFKLKFRAGDAATLSITAGKAGYRDVSLNFLRAVSVSSRTKMYDYRKNAKGVEKDILGRFFISARQQIQSLNIPDFFAKRPFQISLTPGLSTHGLFSSQVVNKFSLNLAGGYTAGADGLEIGGLFNIDKGNARYLQLAGVFNLVGGTMTGLQLAGVNNRALDTVKGVQAAGFINKAEGQVSGLQIAALNNEAHRLKGVQLGLVNVADTSEGASIGLINIIRNGFYKVALSANSRLNTNISFTSGTHRFYTIIHAGINTGKEDLALGLGFGHDFMISNKLFVSASVDYQMASSSTGHFNLTDKWKQGKLLLNAQLTKHVSVFAGPVYNIYTTLDWSSPPYDPVTGNGYNFMSRYVNQHSLGWEAGISFNSVFKPVPRSIHESQNWYLGAAAIAGADITSTETVLGGELYTEREFNNRIAATFSVGYLQNQAVGLYKFDNQQIIPGSAPITYSGRLNFKSMPVKAGMKTYIGKRLFFSGELGLMTPLNQPNVSVVVNPDNSQVRSLYWKYSTSFIVAASGGYTFDNGIETSVKFDKYLGSADIQLVTFRLAYRIRLNKR
jgi:hypothetical protein